MLRHFLLASFGSIRKAPFTTAANILTLALGLACFIAAWGVAQYWRSGDAHHETASRTYVMGQALARLDQLDKPAVVGARSTAAVGPALRQDFPAIERLARVYTIGQTPVAAGANKTLADAAYVEPEFMHIFDFDLTAGDKRTALDRPGSVIIAEDVARLLYGDAPAVGQRIMIGGRTEATVTGVFRPVRQPSFMGDGPDATVRFKMLAHYNVHPGGAQRDANPLWIGTQGWTFLTLKPGFDAAQLNTQLPDFVLRHMPERNRQTLKMSLQAYPITEMAVRELNNTLLADNRMNLTVVMLLLSLGTLTLAVAAINYANLASAQAATRAKEIGMRKTVGATRFLVIAQSWFETLLQSLVALGFGLVILWLAAPWIRGAAGVDPLFFLASGPSAALLLGGLVIAVTLLAGLYPALAMSGVRPVQALQSGRSRGGPKFVARVLVAAQFATASFLLIMLSVTQMQQAHMRQQTLVTQEDPVVMLSDIKGVGVTYDALKAALAREPLVRSMSVVDRPPWYSGGSFLLMTRTPLEPVTENQSVAKHIGHDYFQTLGLKVLAGRVFTPDRDTVSRTFVFSPPGQTVPAVIDADQASSLGFATPQDAVGQTVYLPAAIMRVLPRAPNAPPGEAPPLPIEIIGVVETDRARVGALATPTFGHVYFFAPDSPIQQQAYPIVRIDRRDIPGALAAINRAWDTLSPATPAGPVFYDDLFELAYRQHSKIAHLFMLLASTAFIIASLGLLGIAVHVATRRRHEVAVRKTLGSSAGRVVRLMLADFSRPVIIGNLIAWPLGYLAANAYLSAFQWRIELTAAPFILSMAVTMAIAWAALIGVVLKAATARPVEVLRHA